MSTLERILDSEIIFNYLLRFEKKDWNDVIVNLLETSIRRIEVQEGESSLDKLQANKKKQPRSRSGKVHKANSVNSVKRQIANQRDFKEEYRYIPPSEIEANNQNINKRGNMDSATAVGNMGKQPANIKSRANKNDEIMFYSSIDKLTEAFAHKNNKLENSYENKLNKLTKKLKLIEGPNSRILMKK